jgi:hypothetical protein
MVFTPRQPTGRFARTRTEWTKAFSVLLLVCSMIYSSLQAGAQQMPRIPDTDRVRLAEAFRLANKLQDRVWQGWHKAPFAVLLVTPDYEFLVRHPHPSKDFLSTDYDRLLHSPVYYRKRQFSINLLATFPAVNGLSTIVIGQAENTQAKTSTPWVVTLLHEHFHQWQDSQPHVYDDIAALGLAHGDTTGMWMLNYAFPYTTANVNTAFSTLAQTLSAALSAVHTPDFAVKVAAYRASQQQFQQVVSGEDYKYLQFQLWKEGVARYTEYRIATLAAAQYQPNKDFTALKDYTPYAQAATAIHDRILAELPGMSLEKSQRVAFYSYGAAEALLLDVANPLWQQRYLHAKFLLDTCFML